MSDREAIELAKRELAFSIHISECGDNEGIRRIHEKRSSWLSVIIYLAEKFLENEQRSDENAE